MSPRAAAVCSWRSWALLGGCAGLGVILPKAWNTDVRALAWHSSSWSLLWEFSGLNNSFSVAYDEKGKPAMIGV